MGGPAGVTIRCRAATAGNKTLEANSEFVTLTGEVKIEHWKGAWNTPSFNRLSARLSVGNSTKPVDSKAKKKPCNFFCVMQHCKDLCKGKGNARCDDCKKQKCN